MVGLGKMQIMQILADATNIIAEGEVLQLMNCNDPDTTEASYMQVIYSKTAKLFEAATGLAAIITNNDEATLNALNLYGMHLGTAFQLVDDVLDYNADADQLGKNIGDDLAEGKPTLPLIYAMQHGNAHQTQLIRDAIEHSNGMEHLEEILSTLKQTNALEFTMQKAELEADKAIACLDFLPESEYKHALVSLARIAVDRDH
jgi:octaprenyl-diphosphate synthase